MRYRWKGLTARPQSSETVADRNWASLASDRFWHGSAGRTKACAGQTECKRLLSWNAIDWSVVEQMGGQITVISHTPRERRAGFTLR
jgi:hypothetical protein